MKKSIFPASFAALAVAGLAFSHSSFADWPSYRGPTHDGRSTETVSVWPSAGPKVVWKTPMATGFSSITVAKGRAFTLVRRDFEGAAKETCLALNANTGQELWATPLGVAKYDGGGDSGEKDNGGGDGPRSTPTVDGDLVYILDSRLNLACLDVKTGATKWAKDLLKEHGGQGIYWQNSASPVIEGNALFVCAGGANQSLLAFNKKDGSLLWKGESDKPTHATPTLSTIHGVRQVVFFTQAGLVSAEAKTGKILWRHPYRFSTSTAASPIVGGDIVYCSAGYGVGAGAAKIIKNGETWTATEIWRTTGNALANHWSTPVLKDGYLYGMFQFKEYGTGAMKCVEIATGKEIWSKPNFGPGNVILVGNKIIVLSDRGQVVLVEASPAAYNELARTQAVAGKCWSAPSLSGGRLYVRSTKEGASLELTGKLSSR